MDKATPYYDQFEAAARGRRDVPHAERVGPEGATFWAAPRHAA